MGFIEAKGRLAEVERQLKEKGELKAECNEQVWCLIQPLMGVDGQSWQIGYPGVSEDVADRRKWVTAFEKYVEEKQAMLAELKECASEWIKLKEATDELCKERKKLRDELGIEDEKMDPEELRRFIAILNSRFPEKLLGDSGSSGSSPSRFRGIH